MIFHVGECRICRAWQYENSYKSNNLSWAGKYVFWSGKQKLNTKSSTESEIAGTSVYVPFNILIIMSVEAQGYVVKKKFLF